MFFKRFDSVNAASGSENTPRMQRRRYIFFIEFQDSYNYPVQYPHLKVFLFFKIIHFRKERFKGIIIPDFRHYHYAVILF